MNKLRMQTANKADENFKKLAEMFPNAVTEAIDENGEVVRAIDKDVLMQEISCKVVDGNEERYQFTWPDKKKSVLLANAPINKTLRPCREESDDFDNTENLYIEGDNLEVLKLLQETYLGKIKMIYIDPPYNTGNDFVYEDDFAQSTDEYLANSGQFDEDGNRLVKNLDSNGRFHTDWLNMIYPRLKLAKDLLTDDGVIFISIDDNEVENLLKCCGEVFGDCNFVAQIPWRKRTAKSDVPFGVSQDYEYIICFAKSSNFSASVEGKERKYYETPDFEGRPWRVHDLTKQTTASERPNSYFTIVNPKTGEQYPANPNRTWAITEDTFRTYYAENRIVFPGDYDFLSIQKPVLRYWKEDDMKKAGDKFGKVAVSTKLPDNIGMSQDGTKEITSLLGTKVFSFPKPSALIKYLISTSTEKNDLVLDFFSGSATTAHAVMQINAEDGGHRKFIMVQLPEETDEKSEAYKAGYKNICEIGKERIRKAGKKIKGDCTAKIDEYNSKVRVLMNNPNSKGIPIEEDEPMPIPDIGFRVLKCDTSNMKEVYYNPVKYEQSLFSRLEDNIKEDRTPEDLLFQVMLDLGVLLSSKIEETTIAGKKVFNVEDNYLIACFDDNVTEDVITEIAKQKPYYFVMRDSSMANDSVATNFEQIFATYSPDTVRKVI
ncbi:site-specific DNA-methyltransferase [uncultured Eubacterium sp.]|uniref:site-specific DNA-methyltransferase n=1 Tax=uncultured Eubacterium sp. TaxID=165185 RepID=UPI0025E57A84|nr:site-specific DNA-methyltransferase [uncultured Eubacterium sp.]